jgi:hypothetical protein
MMSEHRSDQKLTLEDLLRVKRAERPPADFWTSFDRELRTRQLAAAVEKPRWWFALPRVFAGFARYQMPMGAAAVLAVTFLTLREYREPGFEAHYPAAVPPASALAEEFVPSAQADDYDYDYDYVPVSRSVVADPVPARAEMNRRQSSPSVAAGTGFVIEEAEERAMTPSARSIAVNLAAIEPELGRLLGSTGIVPSTRSIREPLAELSSLRDTRREPLFAYNADLSETADRDGSRATDRIGNRINETELYDSVRRLSGGGDRLTLKF